MLKTYVKSVAAALAVGGLSALVTRGSMNIYESINKPPLSPPGWLFPVVWSLLFILMGIAAAMVYIKRYDDKKSARNGLWLYVIQLAVNFSWSVIFFNLRAFFFSFWWLVLLLLLAVCTACYFAKVSKTAAWLMVPYILWIIFAGYLNFMIFYLN